VRACVGAIKKLLKLNWILKINWKRILTFGGKVWHTARFICALCRETVKSEERRENWKSRWNPHRLRLGLHFHVFQRLAFSPAERKFNLLPARLASQCDILYYMCDARSVYVKSVRRIFKWKWIEMKWFFIYSPTRWRQSDCWPRPLRQMRKMPGKIVARSGEILT